MSYNFNKDLKTIVIDNGTGYTKMGYSNNLEPSFIIPTAIAELGKKSNITTSNKSDEFKVNINNILLIKIYIFIIVILYRKIV